MQVPSWKLFQNWVSASDDQGENHETECEYDNLRAGHR